MAQTTSVTDARARAAELVGKLTLEEKVALMAGASMWETVPIPRLGIPAMKVSDGPNGARGSGGFVGGEITSACFPAGIGLAATWDTDLVGRIGGALAGEARSKGASMLLGPTVNIHRSPLNGRNFECFSEDPYLSARLAVAYITGLQVGGVGATVKHFVCNDSEFERMSLNVEVDERTLHEIYLPPFRAAVQEAGTWGVMSAYNRVNGTYAAESAHLLRDLLKEEWGFDGLLVSDWTGTYSTAEAAKNGQDLEMPGPTRWRGEKLLQAVRDGEVPEAAIDDAARRILFTIARAGLLEHPHPETERAVNRPEDRALIRQAGAEGAVLLKNDGVLPLDVRSLKEIAVIGPNAKTAVMMGGGSAQVNAHYAVTPYDGIAAKVGNDVELTYARGCTNHRTLPSLTGAQVTPDGGDAHGFAASYFANNDLAGEPVHQGTLGTSEQFWLGEVAPNLPPGPFSARITGTFTPEQAGEHIFSLTSAGLSRLFIDDREVIDNWDDWQRGDSYFGMGSTERTATVALDAGTPVRLRVEFGSGGPAPFGAFRLGHLPPLPADMLAEAERVAKDADVALLFVGLNGDWESEGFDRTTIDLPRNQVDLIERVAAANPRTVVVLQTGSPVAMPWLDQVPAVLQGWFPGQECGNALADVLFGDVNPSGKLPQTYPVRLEDNPAFLNYPGENGHVRYGEGLFVGYRYYDAKEIAPLFPFGFGLSYTSFTYDNVRLSAGELRPDETLTVQIDIKNTGDRAGKETVQLYVLDPESRLRRPHKELKGFAKVDLAPGETKTVSLPLDAFALACWDDAQHAWVAEAGRFEIAIGSSAHTIHGCLSFRLTETTMIADGPGA